MRIDPRRWVGSLALVLALAAGCGGRSGLSIADADPGLPRDGGPPPAVFDGGPPIALDAAPPIDAGTDAPPPISECADGCDDGHACTVDWCDGDRCAHEPRRELCPLDHVCEVGAGCVVRALVHDERELFEITLPTGTMQRLGASPAPLIDLAIARDGGALAATSRELGALDVAGATFTPVVAITEPLDALAFGADGRLYGAAARGVVRIDPSTGEEALVARFPDEIAVIGDLAAVGDRLFATGTTAEEKEVLLEIDPTTGALTTVAQLSFACVHALASSGGALYGMTCGGWVIAIRPETGEATALARHPFKFLGAAAIPIAREGIVISELLAR